MKKPAITLLFLIAFLNCLVASAQNFWQKVLVGTSVGPNTPGRYILYQVDEAGLKASLFALAGKSGNNSSIVELPLADGSFRRFRVWHAPVMPDQLAARHPGIRTFTGEALDNPNITAKLDYTPFGFHAMIFDGINASIINPADKSSGGKYEVHYGSDETREADKIPHCLVDSNYAHNNIAPANNTRKAARTSNGYWQHTYRLALACNHQYAQAATGLPDPTIDQALSKMVTTMNRVNGIYERELSLTMQFVTDEDTLIWTSATGGINGDDPFGDINDDPDACMIANASICSTRVGNTNYDIGHVFTTGAGGKSLVGVVCQSGLKAESVTGLSHPVGDAFDVDFVTHEMGHEFSGYHSFNNDHDGNCKGNIYEPDAYEPGSGSTIMAYAGICTPDNLQPHSDPYFHAVSLLEMQEYINIGSGNTCGVKMPTSNKLVGPASFSSAYNIPCFTPFELTAPAATDSVGDTSVTYCWEEWDLGDLGQSLKDTHQSGPIFRSYLPSKSPTRVFPVMDSVLAGILSFDAANFAEGEKVPDVTRALNFRLTIRNILNGNGCFLIPNDLIHLNAVNTGAGFRVTSQNTPNTIYLGKTTRNITWDVAGTNSGIINTPYVDIYMSGAHGYTWPYFIGTFPNNGSAPVLLPNPITDTAFARIKVKGSGNVFFNVNSTEFLVVKNVDSANANDIKVFPVPATTTLYLLAGAPQQVSIFNDIGQLVWQGSLYGERGISTDGWARGIYVIRLISDKNVRTIKKIQVE